MKKTNSLLVFLFFAFSIQAQHFVLSQFALSPLNVSPSLSGTSGSDQIVINHRNQGAGFSNESLFKTYSLSYDRPFQLKNGDRIGVGARFFHDRAGTHKLTKQFGGLSFSYQKEILSKENQKHFIDLGVEGGLGKISWMFGDIVAEEPEEFENLETNNLFEDFSLGANYRIQFDNQRKIIFGGAIHQLGKTLANRISLYSIFDIKITNKILLSPALSYERMSGADILVATITPAVNLGKSRFLLTLGGRTGSTAPNFIIQNLTDGAFFITPTFYFKNQIGIAATFESNTDDYNDKYLDSFEGSIIYRFGKKKQPILEE